MLLRQIEILPDRNAGRKNVVLLYRNSASAAPYRNAVARWKFWKETPDRNFCCQQQGNVATDGNVVVFLYPPQIQILLQMEMLLYFYIHRQQTQMDGNAVGEMPARKFCWKNARYKFWKEILRAPPLDRNVVAARHECCRC